MTENKKITEQQMLARFKVGQELLAPLTVKSVQPQPKDGADALIELGFESDTARFSFVVESKARSTPEAVRTAIGQAKRYAEGNEALPMIQVPFLSPDRLDELEADEVSGVDLCGNGIVVIPGRLYVVRSGQPNQYRESRPLANPYRGRSATVARILLLQPRWESLSALTEGLQDRGLSLSISQVSKAIAALADELIVTKNEGAIVLSDPLQMMDKLASAWRKPKFTQRQSFRVSESSGWEKRFSTNETLKWGITGVSSVTQYATFSQGGPMQVAVSDFELAQSLLQGEPEPVSSFADVELMETQEDACFFATVVDHRGIRYANRIQTWIELRCGDARQKDAARDLREQIVKELKTWQTE